MRRPRRLRGVALTLISALLASETRVLPQEDGRTPVTATPESPSNSSDLSRRFEEALWLETLHARPREAIDRYRDIAADPDASDDEASHSLLRCATLEEQLGETASARETYRRLVESYPRTRAAGIARARAGGAPRREPARLFPDSTLLYVELVDPAGEMDPLAEILRGTAFENPLEAASAERAAGLGREASAVERAAAFLNRYYFAELAKIGGFAFGSLAAVEQPETDSSLAVFFPGESLVLPGLVNSLVSLESPPRVARVRDVSIYRLGGESSARGNDEEDSREEESYLAFGPELIIWGRPRPAVEAATNRHFVAETSLSEERDFRRAMNHRPPGGVFAYLSPLWIEVAHARAEPGTRDGLLALREVLDLDSLRPISAAITIDRDRDLLRASFHVERAIDRETRWKALETEPLEADLLRCASPESLAFLALRVRPLESRLQQLVDTFRSLAARLPAPLQQSFNEFASRLESFGEDPVARAALDGLDGLVVGTLDTAASRPIPIYVILRYEDPDHGARALEAAIETTLRLLLKNRASSEWQESTLRADDGRETVFHSLSPLPTLRIGWCRIGDDLVLAFSESAARVALQSAARPLEPLTARIPDGASKLLFVRPSRLLALRRRLDASLPREETLERVLSHVETAMVHSRESDGNFALEIEIDDLTSTLRSILDDVAASLSSRDDAAAPPGRGE